MSCWRGKADSQATAKPVEDEDDGIDRGDNSHRGGQRDGSGGWNEDHKAPIDPQFEIERIIPIQSAISPCR